ncbi:Uncharacterised protein [Amycolatopsis camponoti]|uniref:Uncharacterized protein n=1 Tax=Amycolatopsis camponoti TaxID=2606593 RepID=A0A6I8LR06_9PSEU|nr:hypothetical protein [Amycolatopsis camponoti]VVJ18968.1 Uncharacterised protein [Amycolatopsis camponoti]
MGDTSTRVVPLSGARRWTWVVVAIALAFAGWHVYGITVAPERPFFWIGVALDLLVAVVAWLLGRAWPPVARFGSDAVALDREKIPYPTITEVRRGAVSAKPFWLAFWLPTSLLGGLIVALRPSGDFDREVVELGTDRGRRVRTRWRDHRTAETFLAALHDKRPDLEVRYGVDSGTYARDHSPRLGVGGGFLAFGLGLWLFFGAWFGLQLLDRSLDRGPFAPGPTSAAITQLTTGLSGFAPLPGVARDFTEWPCDRANDLILGPDPGAADLHLKLEGRTPQAGDVEARLRRAAGMDPGEYLERLGPDDIDFEVDIPEDGDLYIEFSTGCVTDDAVPSLRDDFTKLAAALGVR